MPSRAFQRWVSEGQHALDEIEAAHLAVGGTGPGRRYATQQINQAYVVMVSSQFQRFCRDLHSEAVDHLTDPGPNPNPRYALLRIRLTEGRKLDSGNPTPANLGADFGRLGFPARFWEELVRLDPARIGRWRTELEELNTWRNAIAHQDFDPTLFGDRTTVRLTDARKWRRTCRSLAPYLDEVVSHHLAAILGAAPW